MSKNDEDRILSVEETAELFEARTVGDIEPPSLDPVGLMAFASMVGQRLASHGGRPTDPSWGMSRKVPMKPETWDRLNEVALRVREKGVNAAPGQIAGILLEKGLEDLGQESLERLVPKEMVKRMPPLSVSPATMREARTLAGVVDENGLWS